MFEFLEAADFRIAKGSGGGTCHLSLRVSDFIADARKEIFGKIEILSPAW